jgi:hypothetical protein
VVLGVKAKQTYTLTANVGITYYVLHNTLSSNLLGDTSEGTRQQWQLPDHLDIPENSNQIPPRIVKYHQVSINYRSCRLFENTFGFHTTYLAGLQALFGVFLKAPLIIVAKVEGGVGRFNLAEGCMQPWRLWKPPIDSSRPWPRCRP